MKGRGGATVNREEGWSEMGSVTPDGPTTVCCDPLRVGAVVLEVNEQVGEFDRRWLGSISGWNVKNSTMVDLSSFPRHWQQNNGAPR